MIHKPSAVFKRLYDLNAAAYALPSRIKLDVNEMVLVAMGGKGVTAATSPYPIIGTERLDTCCGLILHNARGKIAAARHESTLTLDNFQELLGMARDNMADQVFAHFCGVATERGDVDSTIRLQELDDLVQVAAATPNVSIVTFDISEKPHPTGFALDSRNGRLIRLTSLVTDKHMNRELETFYTERQDEKYDFDFRSLSAAVKRVL